jgi:prolipoprotein diacylglyceryltransferase
MWPTIVSVGPLAVQSFGLLLALGIFFGGFVWWQKGREEGFKEEELMDVWILAWIVGFVTSRIWHVVTNWGLYEGSWYKMIFITKFPGLSYEGAWVGVIAMIVYQAMRKKWDLAKLLEISVFSLLIVEMLGTVGSFLAGSSLGKETSWWWGVLFPGVEIRRHPSQLLWALALGGLFILLRKLEKEYRSFKWYQNEKGEGKTGLLIAGYLISVSLLKSVFSLVTEVNWWFTGSMFVLGLVVLGERMGKKNKKSKFEQSESPLIVEKKVDKIQSKDRKIIRKKKGFDFK